MRNNTPARVFWDTMLFIYLLEDNEEWKGVVEALLVRSRKRGDQLFTSTLVLGELLVGAKPRKNSDPHRLLRQAVADMGFILLPFDENAIESYRQVRANRATGRADSIHLACAASAGIDLFLTNDRDLPKLHVPGIKFIANLNHPLL